MIRFTQLLASTTAALTAGALSIAAYAQEFNFSIHHFLSPEASDGRIDFDIFPGMTLGGVPPELFGKVRDGGTGPVWILPFYTPERLPRTEVFELPGVHIGDARATSLAIQDMMDDLAADFEFVHPILLPVHTYKDSA